MAKRRAEGPIEENEEIAEMVAEQAREDVEWMMRQLGNRPWAGEKLSSERQYEAFKAVAFDVAFWQQAERDEVAALQWLSPEMKPKTLYESAAKLWEKHGERILAELAAEGIAPEGYHLMPDGTLMPDAEMGSAFAPATEGEEPEPEMAATTPQNRGAY